jgi:hypothetical protein
VKNYYITAQPPIGDETKSQRNTYQGQESAEQSNSCDNCSKMSSILVIIVIKTKHLQAKPTSMRHMKLLLNLQRWLHSKQSNLHLFGMSWQGLKKISYKLSKVWVYRNIFRQALRFHGHNPFPENTSATLTLFRSVIHDGFLIQQRCMHGTDNIHGAFQFLR